MQHKNPDKVFLLKWNWGGTAPGKSFPATSGKEELYNKLLFYIPKYLFSSTTTNNQNYSFVREKLHPAPPRKLLFLQKHPCVISWLLPCKKAGKSCFDGNKSPATNASNITLALVKLENLTFLFPCMFFSVGGQRANTCDTCSWALEINEKPSR